MAEQKQPKQGSKEQKQKKGADNAPAIATGRPKSSSRGTARLREKYAKEVAPALLKEFELKNTICLLYTSDAADE